MSTLGEAALAYAARGWLVFPLIPGTKTPATKRGRNNATTDPEKIKAWWKRTPNANIGIATGTDGKIISIDIDTGNGKVGRESWKRIIEAYGHPPTTLRQTTCHGGTQLIFAKPAGATIKMSQGRVGADIDVKGEGGYIVTPPSEVTNCGKPDCTTAHQAYAWIGSALTPIEILPGWLVELSQPKREKLFHPSPNLPITPELRREAKPLIEGAVNAVETAQPGARNDQLNRSSFTLGRLVARGALSHDSAERLLETAAQMAGLDEEEIERTVGSGLAAGLELPYEPWPPVPFPPREWNDFGLVDRLYDHQGGTLLWVHKFAWFAYDGRKWKGVDEEVITRKIMDTIRALPETEARHYPDIAPDEDEVSEREKFLTWVEEQKDARPVGRARSLAKFAEGHTVDHEEFDGDDSILNVENGILHVDDRTLEPHNSKFLTTRVAEVAFIPTVKATEWNRLTARLLPDESVRLAAQCMVGYSLMVKANPAKYLIFALGEGDSGKSTFLDIPARMMPTLIKSFELALLKGRASTGPNPDLYDILNARMIYTTEASPEWALRADFIKRITGNDKIRARPNYARSSPEQIPAFVPWIATNAMPEVLGADQALRNRLKVIPFNEVIPRAEQDTTLAARLPVTEGAGILNWILDGYDLYRQGEMPRLVEALDLATDAAFMQTSIFAQFIEEATVEYPGYLEPTSHIGAAWDSFASQHKEAEVSHNKLGRELGGLNWRMVQGKVRAVDGEPPVWSRVGRKLLNCEACNTIHQGGRARLWTPAGLVAFPESVPDF